jgi:hypothetical protein
MSHSIRARVALPLLLLLATGAAEACGGVAQTGDGTQGASEGGAGGAGGSAEGVAQDGGAAPQGGASPIYETGGRGGTMNGGGPSWGGAVGQGGWLAAGGFYSLGGNTGWGFVDSGAICLNSYPAMSWTDRCAPIDACIDLNSPALPSAIESGSSDGGIDMGTAVDERPFCSAPSPRHQYLFAFEESGASYDDFNVVTGSSACQGKSLAFLGIGGVGDAPLTPIRTHCFSVPGDVLEGRLSVVALDPNAHISNLRAVSSCPCAYPIPYNVSSCPGVNGGGGHPNCG